MGDVSDPKQIAHTFGAVTCAAGVGVSKNSGLYLFHSFGLSLPDELIALIKNGEITSGVAGGGLATLNDPINKELLQKSGFKIIYPPIAELDAFAVLSVPDEGKVFYAYESSES